MNKILSVILAIILIIAFTIMATSDKTIISLALFSLAFVIVGFMAHKHEADIMTKQHKRQSTLNAFNIIDSKNI